MKEKRVWIGLRCCLLLSACRSCSGSRRGSAVFPAGACIGCMGNADAARTRKHKACRILSRVGRVLFALFVLSFAAVQVFVIGIAFDEDDPSAAPQADYYLVLGALVNPNGQPSAALAARCDTAIAVLNVNPGSQAILCGGQGAMSRAPSCSHAGLHDRARRRCGTLILENKSSTTIQNIANAKKLLPEAQLLP